MFTQNNTVLCQIALGINMQALHLQLQPLNVNSLVDLDRSFVECKNVSSQLHNFLNSAVLETQAGLSISMKQFFACISSLTTFATKPVTLMRSPSKKATLSMSKPNSKLKKMIPFANKCLPNQLRLMKKSCRAQKN